MNSAPIEPDPLLSFKNVSSPAMEDLFAGIHNLSFSLHAGELLVVRYDSPDLFIPLADLASGLRDAVDGTIMFKGKQWRSLTPFAQCRARGGIRRNYTEDGWISNLTVYDNVLLSSRHHNKNEKALLSEAEVLAGALNINPLPRQLPALCSRHILRRCDWIRLFLAQPEVLFLDRPLIDEGRPVHSEAFVNQLMTYLGNGGSCVWMDHQRIPEQLQAVQRLCYSNGTFLADET